MFSQYGYPGYVGYECEQGQYSIPAVFDDAKKRSIDEVVSPTQSGCMEKRVRNHSPSTLFDMDSRMILPQRADDTAILLAINSLRAEVGTNVKVGDIKDLATKDDINQINVRLDGYAKEVAELKTSFEQHKTDLRELSELTNRNAASIMDLGQQANRPEVGVSIPQRGQYGGDFPRSNQNNTSPKRLNLVIEGVSADKEVYGYLIELGEDMGFVVYKQDIVQIMRLRRRDAQDPKPPPLLVSFVHPHVRDSFLRNKHTLKGNQKYNQIWINADEPMEIRRLKSRFRRIAYLAKLKGEMVHFNHQSITIGDNTYSASQLSQIPDAYKPDLTVRNTTNEQVLRKEPVDDQREDPQEMDTNQVAEKPQHEGPKGPNVTTEKPTDKDPGPNKDNGACRYPDGEPPKKTKDYSQGGRVKMRVTKYGILFSGPTAFVSNMYKRDFYDDDQAKCVSVEQRYGFLEAMFNKEFDLALALTNPELTGYAVKDMCRNLPKNPGLDAIKVPTLLRLMIKKFEQNPDLLQDLIDTAPRRLIEASWDLLWGGGKPFESTDYDDGTFVGVNKFGDMATTWRDKIIAVINAKKSGQKL